jgi:hypothetical protein
MQVKNFQIDVLIDSCSEEAYAQVLKKYLRVKPPKRLPHGVFTY